jgi:hypothetical protein
MLIGVSRKTTVLRIQVLDQALAGTLLYRSKLVMVLMAPNLQGAKKTHSHEWIRIIRTAC